MMEAIYNHINAQKQFFIDKLAQAVAIPSVSGDAKMRSKVVEMSAWLKKEMESLGVEYLS
jgi:Cys-Gly metallodipeptidase DUG1